MLSLDGYIKNKDRCVVKKKFFHGMAVFLFLNLFRACGKVCGKIPRACFGLGDVWKNSIGSLCDKSGRRDKARKRNSFQTRKVIE